MVANMTDDDIWQLNRGGHDPQKIYAAYAAATEHAGQPTVILAKTVKGYGMGEAGEGQNITHQQKKMGENALRVFRDRYRIPIPDERIAEAPFYKPPDDSPEIRYMHERRQALGGYLPARRARTAAARGAAARDVRRRAQGLGRARDLHHDGVRAHPHRARAPPGARQARRADRRRRGAHVRHGGPVPPARHLRVGGPALRAGRPRAGDVLPRGPRGPDPPGGHQRGRRDLVVDRRGHRLREPRRAADPVLHLLLDVRLPARRRPRLGRGRLAHARLPARRHVGPHHARGRRAPAPGRAQPPARVDDPELRRLRPHLRLRARGDHPGRPAPHAHRAGRRLLLHHGAERELRAAADARGRARGDRARHVPARGGRGGRAAARAAARQRRDPARGARGRGAACATTGASRPTSGA